MDHESTNHAEDKAPTAGTTAGTATAEPPGGTPPQAAPPTGAEGDDDFAHEPHIVRGLD